MQKIPKILDSNIEVKSTNLKSTKNILYESESVNLKRENIVLKRYLRTLKSMGDTITHANNEIRKNNVLIFKFIH